jgi:hypothetical protein
LSGREAGRTTVASRSDARRTSRRASQDEKGQLA